MPEQMQYDDIPTAAQNAANDAFALRCGAIGAIAFAFGMGWWLVVAQACRLFEIGQPTQDAVVNGGFAPAMIVGALIGALVISAIRAGR